VPQSEEAQHAYNVRRIQHFVDRIDPRLVVGECDGTLFEGRSRRCLLPQAGRAGWRHVRRA
jgi:hypothetical protein